MPAGRFALKVRRGEFVALMDVGFRQEHPSGTSLADSIDRPAARWSSTARVVSHLSDRDALACGAEDRFRLPVLQPDPVARRLRERRPAVHDRGIDPRHGQAAARIKDVLELVDLVGPQANRPTNSLPASSSGWPSPALSCPAGDPARRRADRQPRLRHRGRSSRDCGAPATSAARRSSWSPTMPGGGVRRPCPCRRRRQDPRRDRVGPSHRARRGPADHAPGPAGPLAPCDRLSSLAWRSLMARRRAALWTIAGVPWAWPYSSPRSRPDRRWTPHRPRCHRRDGPRGAAVQALEERGLARRP